MVLGEAAVSYERGTPVAVNGQGGQDHSHAEFSFEFLTPLYPQIFPSMYRGTSPMTPPPLLGPLLVPRHSPTVGS